MRWVSREVGFTRGECHARWVMQSGCHARWVSCEVSVTRGGCHARWVSHEVSVT